MEKEFQTRKTKSAKEGEKTEAFCTHCTRTVVPDCGKKKTSTIKYLVKIHEEHCQSNVNRSHLTDVCPICEKSFEKTKTMTRLIEYRKHVKKCEEKKAETEYEKRGFEMGSQSEFDTNVLENENETC